MLPHRTSFPVGESSLHENSSSSRLAFSVPVGNINYSYLTGWGGGNQKTCSISQWAFPCTTLQVHYLRIFVISDMYYHQVWHNPCPPKKFLQKSPKIAQLLWLWPSLLLRKGKRKSHSTCRHKQLPSSPTTQNVTVLRLHLSLSLQKCTYRAFAQGTVGSARVAHSQEISILAPCHGWSPSSPAIPSLATWLVSHSPHWGFTSPSIQLNMSSR